MSISLHTCAQAYIHTQVPTQTYTNIEIAGDCFPSQLGNQLLKLKMSELSEESQADGSLLPLW